MMGELVHSLGPPDTQLQVSDLAMSVTPLDSPTSVPTTGVERENPPSSPADAAGAGHDGAQQDDVPSTPPSPAATPERTGTVKYVRVLWDIENIGVTRAHGAVNTVRALRGFLAANGLDGRGIDVKISSFHALTKSGIGVALARQLDHAGVEQVQSPNLCSSVRAGSGDTPPLPYPPPLPRSTAAGNRRTPTESKPPHTS